MIPVLPRVPVLVLNRARAAKRDFPAAPEMAPGPAQQGSPVPEMVPGADKKAAATDGKQAMNYPAIRRALALMPDRKLGQAT